MKTQPTVKHDETNDRDRLALLWKAFEEAELRIAELESELDRRRLDAPRPAFAPGAAHERELHEARQERAHLSGRIEELESRLLEAQRLREQDRLRAQRALQLHDLAREGRRRDAALLLDAQRDLEAIREKGEALEASLRALHAERDRLQTQALTTARQLEQVEDRASQERTAREGLEEKLAFRTRELDETRRHAALVQERNDALLRELRDLLAAHAEAALALQEREEKDVRAAWEREALAGLCQTAEARAEDFAEKLAAMEARAQALHERAEPPARMPGMPRAARLYPVDTNRVGEIHGVREEEVRALRLVGLNLADALLYADLGALSDATGIGAPRLAKLRSLAELMSVRGIGPGWADALHRAGLRGIDDVARVGAERVEGILLEHSRGSMDAEGYRLAKRTVPARARAIWEECRRHAAPAGQPSEEP